MLGLKSFCNTAVVIGGIELAAQIKKGQFQIGKLGGRTARVPDIWEAALAASRSPISIELRRTTESHFISDLHQSLSDHPAAVPTVDTKYRHSCR
jgi:hypothetical protein